MNGLWLVILLLMAVIGWLIYLNKQQSSKLDELARQNTELEREKYLLDFLMDNLPISIYFKDRQSRFIKVSKHMTTHFHTSLQEIVGKTDFDVQDEIHAREAFNDEQDIIRTAKAKIDFLEKENVAGKELWMSTTKMPLLDLNGEVIGTFGISKDVTEVKKQNEELKKNDEKIRAQNIRLQEQQEEMASQNEELVQNQEEISAQHDLLTEQNEKLHEAAELIKKQNESIQLRNENLEEEIERRTKDLVEYNQQLEQFAFITAHNLRAPVARILGLGNVLSLPNLTTEEQISSLQKLIFTVKDLDQVIRDLNIILEVKKSLTQVRSKVDFNLELEKVLSNLKTEIEETKATIHFDFSNAPSIVSFSPYVDSILYNLISNAIKYHHPDRELLIDIKTCIDGEHTLLTVTDNGLGIDVEKYGNQVFNLYKRFHSHIQGKGMGLYLVKSQITTLGGHIHIKSQPNVGTMMMIYFKS